MHIKTKYSDFCFNEMRYRLVKSTLHKSLQGFETKTSARVDQNPEQDERGLLTLEHRITLDDDFMWLVLFCFGEPMNKDQESNFYMTDYVYPDSPRFSLMRVNPERVSHQLDRFGVRDLIRPAYSRSLMINSDDYYNIKEAVLEETPIEKIDWTKI